MLQNIRNAFLNIKIEQKNLYDLRIAISDAERAQNSCKHFITKNIPKELFHNKNEEMNKTVKNNIIKSQKNNNKKIDLSNIFSYILISYIYLKIGNKLTIKYNNIGKRIFPE